MTINSGNPLSALSVTSYMSASLPPDARPQLQTPYDAVALLCHACMISVGFRLIGLGEDHKIEAVSEPSNPQPLPTEWNAHAPNYAFRYAHAQSAMQYVLKLSRLGQKAVVFGLGLGHDKTTSFDVAVADYVSPSALPFPQPSSSDTKNTTEPSDAEPTHDPSDSEPPITASHENETTRALQSLFLSVGRIADLASLFKLSIVQKLAPGIHKEGYEETAVSAPSDEGQRHRQRHRQQTPPPDHDPLRDDRFPPPARPHPFDDPLAAAPRRPFPAGDFPPPGFEDEYEIGRPPRGPGGMGPGFPGARNPLNIGENDLYPPGLGPHDPLRPSFGPGRLGGGGMHPTFDDPLFGGMGGGGGGGGAGGWDSRAPPGARYDPIGPGDGPPNANLRGGPRFPGGGGGMGIGMGGPPNPFGGFGGGDFI